LQKGRAHVRWDLDWIEKRSQLTPDRVAVVDGETNQRWSYQELNQRAHILACFLEKQGVQKGDRVAIICPNHISYFDFLFSCMKLGAIFVPLNWRLSAHEIEVILADCSPKIIGFHSRYENILPKSDRMVQLDHAQYSKNFQNLEFYQANQDLSENDPLTIIYTGGTTGKSKGVVLTHANIGWNALNTIVSWDLQADDVTLTYLPMFHTGGLNALTLPILMMGGTVLIANDFNAEQAVHLIEQEKCTISLMVPTMYHLMIQAKGFETATFTHMKTFLSGGAPCPLPIYEAFSRKGVAFKEGYGLTEAGPNNFYIDPAEAMEKKGSIGKPMMFNKAKVINDEGKEAAPNEVGELLLYGNHVFLKYWNNPEATSETIKNDWLHTGDLAKMDEDGYFYIVGRKKEMIITGGENVYPLEIENCLQNHPSVSEVAVVGLPDTKWGEAVAAFISVTPNSDVTAQELKEYCLTKLGKYKVPKLFWLMPDLPKTHVGKIDKRFLKENYQIDVG
jgi:fatty-acyl-CoA synthase